MNSIVVCKSWTKVGLAHRVGLGQVVHVKHVSVENMGCDGPCGLLR